MSDRLHVGVGGLARYWEAAAGTQSRRWHYALVIRARGRTLDLLYVDDDGYMTDTDDESNGAIFVKTGVPFIEDVRDSVDGSVLAAHWTRPS
jgi:hypothetical protein